jgi:hypothetical protein
MDKLLCKLALSCVLLLIATECFAEWEIVSVATKPFERESYNGPPEIQMDISIRNISDRDILIWGQTFGTDEHFYLIESFIQNSDNKVWERQNAGMSGSFGKIGWIAVKPGQKIKTTRVLYKKYEGKNMILTFRRAYSKGDAKGEEVLLGPFIIPKSNENEQSRAPDARSSHQ